MIKIFLVIIIFIFFYVLIELIYRRIKIDGYWTRKFAHVFTGIGALYASFYIDKFSFIFINLLFFILFMIFYIFNILKSIHRKDSYGDIIYPLGLMFLAYFLYDQKNLFVIGILILAISDTIGAIFGKKYLLDYNKDNSFISYFICTYLFCLLITDPIRAFLITFILSAVESKTFYGFDNLSVPMAYVFLVSFI